jgi:hypothetical protein
VTFKDGTATLGTAAVVVGGSATLNIPNAINTTPLAAGTHSITAVYGGDGNFAGSTSPAITQTVN